MGSKAICWRFLVGLAVGIAVTAGALALVQPRAQARPGVSAAGSWATPVELAWLRRLGAWNATLLRGLSRTGSEAGASAAPAASVGAANDELLRECSARLEQSVGPAPSARLRAALTRYRAACAHLERFGRGSAAVEEARGARLLLAADALLPPGELRALPVLGGRTGVSRIEPRLSRIASDLAGKQVEVRCWSRADWRRLGREEAAYTRGRIDASVLGFAGVGGSRDNLAPSVCSRLAALSYGGAPPADAAATFELAAAVVTLAHEPQHSRGIADEATAECSAIQLARPTALRLGASPAYADELARLYWSRYADELPAYRSPDCRDGGRLDLMPGSPLWP